MEEEDGKWARTGRNLSDLKALKRYYTYSML
jgi:hypothetical protein